VIWVLEFVVYVVDPVWDFSENGSRPKSARIAEKGLGRKSAKVAEKGFGPKSVDPITSFNVINTPHATVP